MMKKLIAAGATVAAMSAFAAMPASALPFSVINAGGTAFEDDSGEFVLRENDNGAFVPVTTGDIMVGDVFAAVLEMTDIGGQSLEALGTEVTGVLLTQVTGIESTGEVTRGGVTFERGDFEFQAAYDLFDDIFGLPEQDAGTVGLLWEDTNNNLDLLDTGGTIPDAIARAIDGDFLARFAMDEDSSFESFEVPLAIDTFGEDFTTGNQQLGIFQFTDLIVAEWFGPGAILDDRFSGSGNLFVPSANNPFPVEDDFQFTLQIPVPGTIGLLGIGLIGLGAAARRRQRA